MYSAYYNDNDPFCVEWLRNLIAAGHLPAGEVDERSVVEVHPLDLAEFDECHFFAGIGGWPLALKWAGWHGPVWTGSCPCQPFSDAGLHGGPEDERHLWPAWFRLIGQCHPDALSGEQVARASGFAWLDHVCADLEGEGYAVAAADLPAACVGAPHIRQRLWWTARLGVGDTTGTGLEARKVHASGASKAQPAPSWQVFERAGRRRVEPGLQPVADGIPGRVGRIRAYGNAIVPQVAAEFIRAVMECRP